MRALLAIALGSCLSACGSNAPEIPEELSGSAPSCAAPDYPGEDLGTEVGNVVKNACFIGYRAPDRVAPTEAHRETVALSDYYDPAGSKGVSLLLVNTAAIWCSACVAEHGYLPERAAELGPRGLVILSTLFQDGQRSPADMADLERWIDNFRPNFPMVADPELQLGLYASPDSAPLNMLVDPRNMKIVRKYIGDQGAVMWPFIEAELAAHSAE